MANIDKYLSAVAVGGQVTRITGDITDSFKSGAYAAFVQSITGSTPQVTPIGDDRAKILLSDSQNKKMRKWFDAQITGSLFKKPEKPPQVVYEMGPIFKPLALKYTLPIGIALLITGYITGKIT